MPLRSGMRGYQVKPLSCTELDWSDSYTLPKWQKKITFELHWSQIFEKQESNGVDQVAILFHE